MDTAAELPGKKEGQHPGQEYWHMKKKIIYEKVSKLLFDLIL